MPKVATKIVPVWAGPESAADSGGVTQSLLGRFLSCRERFRLHVIEGLQPEPTFSHRLEYGNMWHVCEEAFAKGEGILPTMVNLSAYTQTLCKKYPFQQDQVLHWMHVCRVQFPLYMDYWAKRPDVLEGTPLMQEQVFKVPYKLPSGRTVYLRGKWDSVDLVGTGRESEVWLQENKSKGEINPEQIQQQLTFDLQTMLYLIALREAKVTNWKEGYKIINGYRTVPGRISAFKVDLSGPILGVRYNVVCRPLSGGKGSIRQLKPTKSNPQGESQADYYARLAGILKDCPEEYFFRWKVEVSQKDVDRFKRECLDPILEQLCDWYYVVTIDPNCRVWGGPRSLNYRMPYGVYNPTLEGNASDLDAYLVTGSRVGLRKTSNLFPELQE